ncbi:MAG: ATP synthase F1 subunit delta [Firmicutes bacterium]|nr:ATP synthase F1 subunit delta [Bacillota bacterium]
MSRAARPYAEALFEAAAERRAVEDWDRRLQALAAALDEEARAFLASPVVPAAKKRAVLVRALGADAPAPVVRLLELLVERRRIAELPEVISRFHALAEARADQVEAVVETARELDEASRERLEAAVRRLAGDRAVRLVVKPNPELVGGVRVRIADRVFDASVAGKLARLRRAVR